MAQDNRNHWKMIVLVSALVLAGIAVLTSVYVYASKRMNRGRDYSRIFYESIEKLKADCAEDSAEDYYMFYSCAEGELYVKRIDGQVAADAKAYGEVPFSADDDRFLREILNEILSFVNVEGSRISLQPISATEAELPIVIPAESTVFEIGYWNEEIDTEITYAVTETGSILILDQRGTTGKYYILANGMFSELGLLHLQ